MELSPKREFDHRGRKDIYEYVESNGVVRERDARAALRMDPAEFGHHVNVLKRDGVLAETEDGRLRVGYTRADEETHESDEVTFTVRGARQADITGLVGLMRTAMDEDYVVAESVADMLDHEEVLLRHNDVESRVFFVACVDDDVVGWVHVSAPELDKLSHTAELTVGVLSGYRGHGIGSALLSRGVEWSRDQGYEKVYNSVPATNERAVAFLEDHGWHEEARRTDHYRIDDEYVDEVMMGLELD
ncbi:N-acetyltransferase family protein [Halobaculum sp. MBLA0147]|uniref:GNAT family N-acetyltransferase n=1 Tax=Halobaculum sp. MBLA0147 TaxID=3079934 RepID=UPI003523522A